MAAKIFISYRRDDSAGYAGRVHDQLVEKLGSNVFMDVDGIPLGSNFVKALNDEVAKCSALLAVIGPDWLDARDKKGQRRLDNPHDFVRVEIGAALNRQIPVIPILLEGTTIPSADQLPSDLQELSLRNGINVHHDSFRNDMDRLVLGLKAQLRGGNWRDILSSARDERTDRAGPGWTKRALLAATCTAGTAAAVAYLIKIIGDDENRQRNLRHLHHKQLGHPHQQLRRTSYRSMHKFNACLLAQIWQIASLPSWNVKDFRSIAVLAR